MKLHVVLHDTTLRICCCCFAFRIIKLSFCKIKFKRLWTGVYNVVSVFVITKYSSLVLLYSLVMSFLIIYYYEAYIATINR